MNAGAVVRVLLTVGLLALLWRVTDGPAAVERLRAADPAWLAAAFAALTLHTLLCALRWRLTAAQLGQGFGLGRAVREYYLAQLVNFTLPGGVLGDTGRAVRAGDRVGYVRAGQAVVLERLAGQVALIAVLFAGLVLSALVPGGSLATAHRAAGALAALAGGAAVAAILVCTARRRSRRQAGLLASMGAAARQALQAPGVWQRQALLSLLAVGCSLAAFACCARATGAALPPVGIVTLVPLTLLAMLVPVGIGGWGPRELSAAALWPLAGLFPADGVAASVAFGLVALAASLPGLGVPWWRGASGGTVDLPPVGDLPR
jgi:uncharacterized membrane protein YbhN (UPF0104 family)